LDEEKEISRQEEARRILDAIRHKENAEGDESAVLKPISQIPAEDANQLQALLAQKLKLKPEEPVATEELPVPDNIDPISTEQIKVIRKFAATKSEVQKPLKTALIDGIIKAYFEIADSFKLKPNNQRSCFKQDHQCAHCGKKIPFAALEEFNKAAKNKDKTGAEGAAEAATEHK